MCQGEGEEMDPKGVRGEGYRAWRSVGYGRNLRQLYHSLMNGRWADVVLQGKGESVADFNFPF